MKHEDTSLPVLERVSNYLRDVGATTPETALYGKQIYQACRTDGATFRSSMTRGERFIGSHDDDPPRKYWLMEFPPESVLENSRARFNERQAKSEQRLTERRDRVQHNRSLRGWGYA